MNICYLDAGSLHSILYVVRPEAFFSHECFVVIGDDIYFNTRNSTY